MYLQLSFTGWNVSLPPRLTARDHVLTLPHQFSLCPAIAKGSLTPKTIRTIDGEHASQQGVAPLHRRDQQGGRDKQ
jgi:hypothetical protein